MPRPPIDHIRKPQILRAAAEVITEKGLAQTRIADVAERAGTSAPAVIYWFESRDRLLSEALVAAEAEFAEDLDARLAALPTAAAKLRTLIVDSSIDEDLSLWMELWARALHDEPSAADRRRLDADWRARIAAVVAEGQASGEFTRAKDPTEFAVLLASVMDGLAVQVTLDDEQVNSTRMIAICTELAEVELGADLSNEPEEVAA